MTIVPSLGHGMVPTIFWSACAEGVLKENDEHLDPDGCLVQQREHRTWRICGKGGGRHEADTAKQGLAGGGNFVKKKVAGRSSFS